MRFDAKPIGRRPRSWWLKASATALSTFMAWSPALAYAQDTDEEAYVETDVDVTDTIDPSEIGVDATDEGPPLDGAAATPTTEPDPSATPISLPSTEEGGSGVTPQAISLPDAEGSVEGMGESFSPVLSSGTATFSVPIAVAPGRAGVQPSLALSYATTGGNGPVGFGWNLGAPFISRQTDRGMPQYIDEAAWHQEEDRFIYNGGQELVPVANDEIAVVDDHARYSGDNANGIPDEFDDWQQYRARVEGSFMRFFRSRDSERWIVQSTDGTRFEFGRLTDGAPTAITASSNAVERDPEVTGTTGGIFRWCLTRMSDAHGSTVYYVYDQDDGRSYLSDVYYVSPNSCGGSGADDARTCNEPLSGYAARVHLEYEPRQDVFAGYVSGWRIATARRLKRVDVSAYNDTLAQRTRVRRYHLTYDPASFHSLLTSVQVEGRPQTCTSGICEGDATVPEGSNTAGERLPAMTFEYSEMPSGSGASDVVPGFGGISQQVNPVSNSPPHSVDESRSDLFDVNSDGLPDLVVTDPARYRTEDGRPAVGVFFNGFTGRRATPAGAAATFSDAVPMAIPYGLDTVMSLGNANVVPMDIDGDGRGDLLHMPRFREYGWWSATRRGVDAISPADQGWEWTYAQVALPPDDTDPRIDLGRDARHIRVLDVNNDHLIDIVRTTGTVMQTWVNLGWLPGGEGRFGSYRYTDAGAELSTEPYESCLLQGGLPIDFEDPEVRLGDMNGDGLQDIVQMRRGRVVYWPGRGEGVWGTGSRRCDRGEGAGRQVEMANPPPEVNPELDGVYLSDVNMDGADDMVQVRFREVDVWFNEAGEGWTRRTIARSTPTAPAFAPRVRFTDIDGSATTDIVWANAGRWEYIDPTGGQRPRLLVAVHNGLGADTDITYGSSAQDYLRDLEEAASTSGFETFDWNATPTGPDARLCELSDQAFTVGCTSSTPDEWLLRSTGSPVVSTVVRAVSTTDNFDRLGRTAQVSESQFAYHDGYYEGIEQEFRGFGAADAVTVGDWNNPTVYSRTHFLQGRRPSEIEGDRLAENPNEALKGREVLTEVFDDSGDFLSTSFATMANRHLATGLDGRAIHYAFVRETNELRYDTTPFVAGSATLELDAVQREAVNPATGAVGSPVTERTRTVAVRADVAHTSRIRTEFYEVLNIGAVRSRREHGRVGVLSNDVIDYRRAHQNLMELINDAGQWIWRSKTAHVEAVGWHPLGGPRLGRLTHHYFDNGDVDRSIVDMGGSNGSPEDHAFGADPANEGGAASYTQTEQNQNLSYAYDAWGQPIAACHGSSKLSGNDTFKAGCLRFSRTDYDDAFHQVVETEQIFWHRNSHESLDSSGEWDRGLGAITVATDPNGLDSTVTYDGLGRLTSVTPPNVAGCSGAQVTTHIEYELTTNPSAQPISRVTSTTELDCAGVGAGEQLQSIAYVDGLGRARATLATSENGGEWIRSGITTLDKKGTVRRTYQTDRFDGSATDFGAVVALPSTPYAVVRYDAFGRTRGVIAEDGAVTWTSYHSLSTDVCDPLDNDPSSPFFHTCTTTVVDGFGRTIDQILRNVDPDDGGSEETYHLWTYYRVDDAVSGLVRANGGTRPDWYDGTLPSDAVLRTFVYDRHGRRLASDDPDTDDPNGAGPESDSWRYLYNQVNDLIAVRDPRGCGQNFFYDHAGRLRGEQYVSCTEAQSARAEQPAHSASGLVADGWSSGSVDLDVEYHYDTIPSWATGAPTSNTEGRATGVSDRGQRAAIAYDERGNAVWTARQMALISDELGLNMMAVSGDDEDVYYDRPEQTEQPAISATVTYDTDHTYVRTATFDNAGRPLGIELPEDPDFSGTAPTIEGLLDYNDRGLPSEATLEVDGTPQTVVASIDYLRDGLVSRIVYGDDDDGSGSSRTPTESETFYDVRRRPIRMRTTRASTGTGTLDEVTAVADQELVWDGANNLTAVVDHRDPDEWDAGHLPQTVTIGHDALYRVTRAEYLYTQTDGSRTTSDDGTNWRTNFNAAQAEDPMRQEPAGIAPGALLSAGQRVHTMSWGWDYLANQTETNDNQGSFYERSIGAITNGDALDERPSALYLAHNLDLSMHPTDQRGWLEVDYGVSGNMVSMTVHARCDDAPGESCTTPSGTLDQQRDDLTDHCACDIEQHYVYRWDELNRLAEARRYDRTAPGAWELQVRQRYRYDGANQRTVKQTLDEVGCGTSGMPCERTALYVYPGDFERRGLSRGSTSYDADADLDTESQYVVAGARVVVRSDVGAVASYQRDERVVVPVTDLIQTSSAAFDVRTGRLVEASTYYPNGARETYVADASAAAEPRGFTSKEGDEEVGLVYFGERYLVPRLGRWATPDPLHVHAVGGGEALNSYHYVGGNLLSARDPLGLNAFPPPGTDRVSVETRDADAGERESQFETLPTAPDAAPPRLRYHRWARATDGSGEYEYYYFEPWESGGTDDPIGAWRHFQLSGGATAVDDTDYAVDILSAGAGFIARAALRSLLRSGTRVVLNETIEETAEYTSRRIIVEFGEETASRTFRVVEHRSGLVSFVEQGHGGRLERITADLDSSFIGNGSSTNASSRRMARTMGEQGDDAGHAIANNLGGGGGVSVDNIFAQNPGINRGDFRVWENQVAEWVSEGRRVGVDIGFRYTQGSTRPSEIVYNVVVDGQAISRTFGNPTP